MFKKVHIGVNFENLTHLYNSLQPSQLEYWRSAYHQPLLDLNNLLRTISQQAINNDVGVQLLHSGFGGFVLVGHDDVEEGVGRLELHLASVKLLETSDEEDTTTGDYYARPRRFEVPSLHCHDSWPSHDAGGGFFVDGNAPRRRPRRQARRLPPAQGVPREARGAAGGLPSSTRGRGPGSEGAARVRAPRQGGVRGTRGRGRGR